MKKILAILVSALLILGMFAGCSEKAANTTEPNGDRVSTPVAAGLLVLNVNAAINISYDADGLVLNVEGIDDNGSSVVAEYSDYLGKSCSEAICDLIAASNHSGFLTSEENYVLIKQAVDSVLPGANFLEEIEKDAKAALEAAGSTAVLVVLTVDNLDENGYINLESAKNLAAAYLCVDSLDTVDGTSSPISGQYNFRITAGDIAADLIVDGTSGDVYEGTLDEAQFEEDETESDLLEVPETEESNTNATEPSYPTEPVHEEIPEETNSNEATPVE